MHTPVCNITRELLKYRNVIESKFKTVFDSIFYELKPEITAITEISDRQIKHIALLLTPVQLLQNNLELPFDYSTYKQSVIENTIKQNEMASTIRDVTIFWEAIAFKLSQPKSEIKVNTDYLKDPVNKNLFIKFPLLFPYYKEYVKKNGLNDLDANSLKSLLTSKGNTSFIQNTTQKSRDKAINKKPLGSCYRFKYEDIPEGIGIIINDVELNL